MSKRVVVTRSQEQAAAFAARLQEAGFTPVIFPVIQFVALPPDPLDAALAQLDQYRWLVFTSANAVDFFFRHVHNQPELSALPPIAAVGSATQRKLADRGISVDFMPAEFTGAQLATGLPDTTDSRILLPRAKIGRPKIVNLLREQGATVDDVPLYDTVTAVPTPTALADLQAGFDALTFTSPSSVRNFCKILNQAGLHRAALLGNAVIAAIGPVTAAEAAQYDLPAALVPDEYTIPGLVRVLQAHFAPPNPLPGKTYD